MEIFSKKRNVTSFVGQTKKQSMTSIMGWRKYIPRKKVYRKVYHLKKINNSTKCIKNIKCNAFSNTSSLDNDFSLKEGKYGDYIILPSPLIKR